jgi:hypothetical protein
MPTGRYETEERTRKATPPPRIFVSDVYLMLCCPFDDYESKTRQQGVSADKYTVILIYTLRNAIDVGSLWCVQVVEIEQE